MNNVDVTVAASQLEANIEQLKKETFNKSNPLAKSYSFLVIQNALTL